MATLSEGNLDFHFDTTCSALRYDTMRHHTEVLQNRNCRAMDFVAVLHGARPERTWLLEVKDFRVLNGPPRSSTISELAGEVEKKARDTRDGLVDAAANATNGVELEFARRAISGEEYKIVLHLQPFDRSNKSKLYPKHSISLVLQKLKTLVYDIDKSPLVLDQALTQRAAVPWSVSDRP